MDDPELNRLQWSLRALCQQAGGQVSLYPPFVQVADELALDFDDSYRMVVQWSNLTEEQKQSLSAIDAQLGRMTGQKDVSLWGLPALERAPEWQLIRSLAYAALRAFGWPTDLPSPSQDAFVSASRSNE